MFAILSSEMIACLTIALKNDLGYEFYDYKENYYNFIASKFQNIAFKPYEASVFGKIKKVLNSKLYLEPYYNLIKNQEKFSCFITEVNKELDNPNSDQTIKEYLLDLCTKFIG